MARYVGQAELKYQKKKKNNHELNFVELFWEYPELHIPPTGIM